MLSLTLLVTGVGANHHNISVTANHATAVADSFDTRANLHFFLLLASYPFSRAVPSQYPLFVAINDSATGQVVRTQLHNHAILGEDTNVVLTHLARNVGKNLVTVGQLNTKHRVGQGLDNRTFDFDDTVFVGHSLFVYSYWSCWSGWPESQMHTKGLVYAEVVPGTNLTDLADTGCREASHNPLSNFINRTDSINGDQKPPLLENFNKRRRLLRVNV